MQPHDKTRPSLDPVSIARGRGSEMLYRLLCAQGRYVPQHRGLMALTKALRDEHSLLLEGERGVGKTAMPEALAMACNLPLFFFPCMDGVKVEEMLASFDSNLQSQYVRQQLIEGGNPREQVQRAQWTESFLNYGEIGAAFRVAAQSNARVILCVDEVDKLDERREDALLQVLARGYFDVPRLIPDSRIGAVPRADGTVPPRPLVFLTSNNMRGGTSSPLRSRCYYSFIHYPSQPEQVAILRVRVPRAHPAVVAQVVKMITYIRSMTAIVEKPALREMIDLTESLVRDGVEFITREVIDDCLCVIAKLQNDEAAISERMSTIEDIVGTPEREIDDLVARVYQIRTEELYPRAVTQAPMSLTA